MTRSDRPARRGQRRRLAPLPADFRPVSPARGRDQRDTRETGSGQNRVAALAARHADDTISGRLIGAGRCAAVTAVFGAFALISRGGQGLGLGHHRCEHDGEGGEEKPSEAFRAGRHAIMRATRAANIPGPRPRQGALGFRWGASSVRSSSSCFCSAGFFSISRATASPRICPATMSLG